MESKGFGSRKFSQTFLLAEQPSGYFVLNDMFRFLKEDDYVVDGDYAVSHAHADVNGNVADHEEVVTVVQENSVEVTELSDNVNGMVEATINSATATATATIKAKPTQPAAVVEPAEVVAPATTAVLPPNKKESAKPSKADVKKSAATAAATKETAVTAAAAAAAAAPVKNEPAAPKTWASLADSNKERWAKHASETKGQAVVPESVPAPAPVVSAAATTAASTKPAKKKSNATASNGTFNGNGPAAAEKQQPQHQQQQHQQQAAAAPHRGADSELSVFIRGFTKSTKIQHIKEEFAKALGQVRWVELVTEVGFFLCETLLNGSSLPACLPACTIIEHRVRGIRGT